MTVLEGNIDFAMLLGEPFLVDCCLLVMVNTGLVD